MISPLPFLSDERGNAAVVFALALLPVVGAAGAAVDYSRLSAERTRLQAVVDRAAIAATLAPDASDTQRIAVATSFFPPPPPASAPPVPEKERRTLTVTPGGSSVVVEASVPVKTAVMDALGFDWVRVSVRSRAETVETGRPVCVLALHPNARDAISFAGNATFTASGCAIHANSTSGSAISQQGSATAKAWSFCAVGGVSQSGGLTSTNPASAAAKGGCFRQKDPFKDLPRPTVGLCTGQTTNVSVNPNQTKTLDPGTYCNGLDLKGTVTLRPGVYVIKGGTLSISSQANVTGEGVTFYLTDTGASFDINGGGTVRLSAPTTGDLKNMLIMQNPASNPGAVNKLNGNSTTHVKGAIYVPTQTISITGSGGFGSTGTFMPLVASMLSFSGNSTTQADVANHPTPAPLPLSEIGARLTH